MSRKIEIKMVRLYRVIDNDTEEVVFETLDYNEAADKAGFPRPDSMITEIKDED